MPAVDRYASGELNAHFVYVVNYGRTPNIRAGNEGLNNPANAALVFVTSDGVVEMVIGAIKVA